VVIISKGVKRA